jgi:hypothetical protein
MRRMEAHRRKASARRFRHSQSLANRRQRLSQAMVRSTIQRFGSTTNLRNSDRLTISMLIWRQVVLSPAWKLAPWYPPSA